MKGIIFDIKEFSIHDGPGGRTTVFLKGCPLRCIWCHNPEGLSPVTQLMKKHNLCTHCGTCKVACDHEECKPFGVCVYACPNGCLSISGQTVDSCELAERLKKDADIFKSLGGGITISGGEPLMQPDFVCDLADRLDGIHKAIQTSGYADPETYKKVIGRFDFIMQDIKLADENEHLKYTGVSNRVILKNIEWLKVSGKSFVLRVPQIPGITDTEANMKAIHKIAGQNRIELLKYNELASVKYAMLNMRYKFQGECNDNKKDSY